jgi:hypothetical protein
MPQKRARPARLVVIASKLGEVEAVCIWQPQQVISPRASTTAIPSMAAIDRWCTHAIDVHKASPKSPAPQSSLFLHRRDRPTFQRPVFRQTQTKQAGTVITPEWTCPARLLNRSLR